MGDFWETARWPLYCSCGCWCWMSASKQCDEVNLQFTVDGWCQELDIWFSPRNDISWKMRTLFSQTDERTSRQSSKPDNLNLVVLSTNYGLAVFINNCLRKALNVRWPYTIIRNFLLVWINQTPAKEKIRERCWMW